jgi:hypothetical protein
MPQDAEQIGAAQDYADMIPIYTLLQDDKMVTKITSVSDELLDIPSVFDDVPSYLKVQIDVHLRPRLPVAENVIFFADEAKVWNHKYDDALPYDLALLSDNELRSTATQCIYRIQALSASLDDNVSAHFNRDLSFDERHQKMVEELEARRVIWQTTMWPKALAIKQELCRRVFGEPPYPQSWHSSIIDSGALAGPNPLASAAVDLEQLVRRLS